MSRQQSQGQRGGTGEPLGENNPRDKGQAGAHLGPPTSHLFSPGISAPRILCADLGAPSHGHGKPFLTFSEYSEPIAAGGWGRFGGGRRGFPSHLTFWPGTRPSASFVLFSKGQWGGHSHPWSGSLLHPLMQPGPPQPPSPAPGAGPAHSPGVAPRLKARLLGTGDGALQPPQPPGSHRTLSPPCRCPVA